MSFSDIIYRPFETLIRPLDIPPMPLPASGPFALLLHFARMFRGVLVAVAALMVAIEGINLATIWGVSFIVDGASAKGAAAFLEQDWPTLAMLGVLIFPVLPLLIFLGNTLIVGPVRHDGHRLDLYFGAILNQSHPLYRRRRGRGRSNPRTARARRPRSGRE